MEIALTGTIRSCGRSSLRRGRDARWNGGGGVVEQFMNTTANESPAPVSSVCSWFCHTGFVEFS